MRGIAAMLAIGITGCQSAAQGPAPHSAQPASLPNVVRAEAVARGLSHPWAIAFLPDGRMVVTERDGRVRIVTSDGTVSPPLTGVPRVAASGQGGLLDVAIDPAFAQNRTIYLSYAEPGDDGVAGTAVARAKIANGDAGLEEVRVIYRQEPKVRSGGHFGSRIVFQTPTTIFITQGDRFNFRNEAQNLKSLLGKVVRVNTDGSIPKDNPFVGRGDARPEIWSYGHRNVQGAALNTETGQLWTIEHGAAGGDELNHPQAGKNYGWPVITYGRDYNGRRIGEGAVMEGMEQPVFYWDPVIAPSGMAIYTGDKYSGWKGSIFVGSLNPGALVRIVLENGQVVKEERFLGELGERIRDVQQGPDGYLYIITDANNGRVLKVLSQVPSSSSIDHDSVSKGER